MLRRFKHPIILERLGQFPAVALLGCRQVGKTTLALHISKAFGKEAVYVDLERPRDRVMLDEPELFLRRQAGKLVILDEVHLVPELFPVLRGIIDEYRRNGDKSGHFLILGSASPELLEQSSETLAGRIAYVELDPFSVEEAKDAGMDDYITALWVRGGFPDSFLASSDEASLNWREEFIRTYLKHDLPELAANLPAELMYRLWRMLALDQGGQLNMSNLARNLSISGTTVRKYIDTLSDLFLVRQLAPWHGNSKKRLVKVPKVYIRDSGILHALVGVENYNTLSASPIYGASWEGFIIEQILQAVPRRTEYSFYRTGAGAEVDLVLQMVSGQVWAIEIKRTTQPRISKGFRLACDDIKPDKRFYVVPDLTISYDLDETTQAIGLETLIHLLGENI